MKRFTRVIYATCFLLLLGIGVNVQASGPFVELPFTNDFEHYGYHDLDWVDQDDDYNTGSTALGFSVAIGGATYDYFDMDSNGYIELLTDEFDSPTEYSFGNIDPLIGDEPTSTYILAAYDDLSSYYYGYYGYRLYADRAVFYYDVETYPDEDDLRLNNFEVFLYDDGRVQWNFNYADYEYYDHDLFSGLYFGNTGTLLELARDEIPEYKSYLYIPEPSTYLLLGTGLLGLAGVARRKMNSR